MTRLLDEELAFGFNGGPGVEAAMLNTGEVVAAYETGAHCRVWELAPGAAARAISPVGLEVFGLCGRQPRRSTRRGSGSTGQLVWNIREKDKTT